MNAIDGKYSIGPNNAQKHERLWYNCILGSIQFLDYTRFSCQWFSTGNGYDSLYLIVIISKPYLIINYHLVEKLSTSYIKCCKLEVFSFKFSIW